jgi:diguanylate cyclase (GGDEF)-like protein
MGGKYGQRVKAWGKAPHFDLLFRYKNIGGIMEEEKKFSLNHLSMVTLQSAITTTHHADNPGKRGTQTATSEKMRNLNSNKEKAGTSNRRSSGNAETDVSASRKEFFGVILFSIVFTYVMAHFDAFDRLYLFTRGLQQYGADEFPVFFPAFMAMGLILYSLRRIQELESEIRKRQEAEKALRESELRYKDLSITDDLTKIYNSRHFSDRLTAEVDRTNRYDRPLSLLMLDIDNFKDYNDRYGHPEGDKVLSAMGRIICECIRRTDTAFRYGGEEFSVILPETAMVGAVNVAERIRTRFESEVFRPLPDQAVSKTVSIGVGQYDPKDEIEAFVKRADDAMYDAKKRGKNLVVSASSSP